MIKTTKAETQQALAASMTATDHILLLKVPAILAAQGFCVFDL